MRNLGLALAVLATVLIGLRLYQAHQASGAAGNTLSTPDNSDYYMTDATVYQMGKNGQLVYRMTAAQTLHFADDSARLEDIDVHYLAKTTTYWDVTAKRGRVPAGQHDIYLYGGVKARHPNPDGSMVHLTTDNAWVRPDANRIDSKAHVKAIEPGRTVEGDGLRVNLDTDKLNLLNNVHVTYTQ